MITDRNAWLEEIRSNIINEGHHVYLIMGGASPRFGYTIGLSEGGRFELILAGAAFYSTEEVSKIINTIAAKLRSTDSWHYLLIDLELLGKFSLRAVESSWVKKMMLGALDFYNVNEVLALQIIPDPSHMTNDTPNLAKQWSSVTEPAWKWLEEKWIYPVSEQSTAVTNLNALRGEAITEVMRWEQDQWEMFAGAGPDVSKEDIRVVSLGTLLGLDQSLYPVVQLNVEKGLWRDSNDLTWHPWG